MTPYRRCLRLIAPASGQSMPPSRLDEAGTTTKEDIMSAAAAHPTVHEVKHADLANNTFDGKKPDLYINTGTLGGKHFLFTVEKADGRPTLIAIHL